MHAHIHVPVKNLSQSLDFYTKLGYQKVKANDEEAFITDGCIILHLNNRTGVGHGLTFYVEDLEAQIKTLKKANLPARLNLHEDASYKEILVEEPNAVGIRFLAKGEEPVFSDLNLEGALSHCGAHYGIGIMATEFVAAIDFWEALGYKLSSGNRESKSYVEMTNDTIPIGIYREGSCPHLFITPSLTYFEKDMADRIALLKSKSVVFVEEITQFNEKGIVDHAIWAAPDGLHAFLFCC